MPSILMFAIAIVVILLSRSLRVVKEYDRGVIFFLGKFTGVRGPGLIILIPILEQMTRVTLRTVVWLIWLMAESTFSMAMTDFSGSTMW